MPINQNVKDHYVSLCTAHLDRNDPDQARIISRIESSPYIKYPRVDYIPRTIKGQKFNDDKIIIIPKDSHEDVIPLAAEKYNGRNLSLPSAVAIGPIICQDPVIVNYRSVNNHIRGLCKRVCHQNFVEFRDNDGHPTYNGTLLRSFKKFVQNQIKKYEPLDFIPFSHEFLDSSWLNSAHSYTLKQKAQFHKLLDSVLEQTDLPGYIQANQSKFYTVDSFVKREFYAEMKEARVINARPNLFKAVAAPYIKEIEHRVIYNEHFIKGKTPDLVAERMSEIVAKYKYVAETDYSSFEGSFQQEFQRACEYQLFKHMLKNNPIIWSIIKPIYFSRAHAVLKTSGSLNAHASFIGSRMSGDMWTSLANGFTNMMLFLFICKHSCTHREFRNKEFDYIVEGDDGFFGFNFEADFDLVADLGFKLKLNYANDINDLSFCGIQVGPNNTPVPDFRRTIVKFGWAHDELIIRNYSDHVTSFEKELMRAKAMSLLATSPGNPILQPLALKVIQLTSDIHKPRDRYFDWWDKEIFEVHVRDYHERPITSEMRQYYSSKYNISADDQIRIESIIDSCDTLRFELPLKFNENDKVLPMYFSCALRN